MDTPRLTMDPVPREDRTGLLYYPLVFQGWLPPPLQGRRVAHLYLPPDLTRRDVTRLIAMLTALEVAPDPPLPHRPFDPPD